ncbi:TetR/AcrR family transcriptional regulator [Micromonospora sp. CA-111912]|uniref:TetR/AcrR family transcriptional regulator n=1 Tax=Micromonospora sp. CA-111912 TaxID=3239955 RepID=UPI003D92E1E3
MTGVWLRPRRTSRTGPPLSRERIVAEAVALLDAEGVEGLTMRRLAQRLDAGPTTLYWHVSAKEDVVDLALDQIFGEVRLPADAGDWADDVRALLTGWRAAMVRHPWSAALIGRPLLGPNVLTRTEHLQAALRRGGLVEPHLGAATHALANYVIGAALTHATWQQLDDPEARHAAREHLAGQRDTYPTLVEHGHLDDRDWDETFDHGLTYLLDGIRGHIRSPC